MLNRSWNQTRWDCRSGCSVRHYGPSWVWLVAREVVAMQKITPFLSFNGQAEEAARFYVSLFPDSRIDRVTRSPLDTPGGPTGKVLIVEFTLAGFGFTALAALGRGRRQPNQALQRTPAARMVHPEYLYSLGGRCR